MNMKKRDVLFLFSWVEVLSVLCFQQRTNPPLSQNNLKLWDSPYLQSVGLGMCKKIIGTQKCGVQVRYFTPITYSHKKEYDISDPPIKKYQNQKQNWWQQNSKLATKLSWYCLPLDNEVKLKKKTCKLRNSLLTQSQNKVTGCATESKICLLQI